SRPRWRQRQEAERSACGLPYWRQRQRVCWRISRLGASRRPEEFRPGKAASSQTRTNSDQPKGGNEKGSIFRDLTFISGRDPFITCFSYALPTRCWSLFGTATTWSNQAFGVGLDQ